VRSVHVAQKVKHGLHDLLPAVVAVTGSVSQPNDQSGKPYDIHEVFEENVEYAIQLVTSREMAHEIQIANAGEVSALL